MAKVIHGKSDTAVKAILGALNDYEKQFAGSEAAVYRQNPGAVRVRIIDDRFVGISRSRRRDDVWEFLKRRLGEDAMTEISALVLSPKAELRSSLANLEFDDPLPSRL